ncbi:RDD family protein [Breoghania sp.]|uniref:RDD family protein n=1 Tax=Breoghania sp. TaxID=2065378 RepID=UPI0029CA51D0|nr:RDD family protein [Breoghania sp.]
MQDRCFSSRAVALLIDLLVVSTALTVVFYVLSTPFSARFIVPSFIKTNSCEQSNFLSNERMEQLLPLKSGEQHIQRICETRSSFLFKSNITYITAFIRDGNKTYSRSIAYYSDELGNHTRYYPMQLPFYIILALSIAIITGKFATTPGKKYLGLQVTTESGGSPSVRQCLIREMVKFFPLFALAAYETVGFENPTPDELAVSASKLFQTMESSEMHSAFSGQLAAGILIFIAFIWFQFGSFIRWRGQTYWDRLAGLYVKKSA